jgi:hypothetical protein
MLLVATVPANLHIVMEKAVLKFCNDGEFHLVQ